MTQLPGDNAIYEAEQAARAAGAPQRYRFGAPTVINGLCVGVLWFETYTLKMAQLYQRDTPDGSIDEL